VRLPKLAANRWFMSEFIAANPPCLALDLVEVGDIRCALLALRPEAALPRSVTVGGFGFGHSLLGASSWEGAWRKPSATCPLGFV